MKKNEKVKSKAFSSEISSCKNIFFLITKTAVWQLKKKKSKNGILGYLHVSALSESFSKHIHKMVGWDGFYDARSF